MQPPKFGNKPELTIFVLESPDLEKVILQGRLQKDEAARPVSEWVREKYGDRFTVHLRTGRAYRSDILLQQISDRGCPAELAAVFGEQRWTGQFTTPFADSQPDVVVLSLLPDIRQEAWAHRTEAYRLAVTAEEIAAMTPEQAAWFKAQFTPLGRLGKPDYQESFGKAIEYFKQVLDVHVIVFGVSSIDLADPTHNYHGKPETLAYRAALFNTEAIRFSFSEGISIVDVDRTVAEVPGEDKVPQVFSYAAPVNEAIAREFFRIVEDIGFFEDRPLLAQVGQVNG